MLDDPTPVCFGNTGCPAMVRYGHGQWTSCGAEPELAGYLTYRGSASDRQGCGW